MNKKGHEKTLNIVEQYYYVDHLRFIMAIMR